MIGELLFQGGDILEWIKSNFWIVIVIAILVGGVILDGFFDLILIIEDHVLGFLCTIFAIIVGVVCYLKFGLIQALVAVAAITALGIVGYLYLESRENAYYEPEPEPARPSRKSSKKQSDEEYEDDDYPDEEEFDDEPKSKKPVKKQASKKNAIMLKDIAGLDEAKEAISIRVILPIQHPEVYEKYNKKVGGGILLYGLPGTGKTMFAQAVANELDAVFYEVKCSDIVSKWYGESEQRIKKLFRDARRNKRAVIFFDEFEALGQSRNNSRSNDINIVPELLAQIQGFDKNDSTLLLLAATNRPWDIDSALLRPGRFNEKIMIPLPDGRARRVIIEKQLKGVPIDEQVSVDRIVEMTDGFNGADVVEFCDQLKNGPILRSIGNKTDNEKITMADVESTAKKVKSSVSEKDILLLEEFERNNA